MEREGIENTRKRSKATVEQMDPNAGNVEIVEEDIETNPVVSEEMELAITHILEKINCFTQLVTMLNYRPCEIEHVIVSNKAINAPKFEVSELLESGKSLIKELSNEFEERLILIHKGQIEKWKDEIKELRMLDASNEENNALLHSAQHLLRNIHADS